MHSGLVYTHPPPHHRRHERTGMSTYLESDFFQQTVLGCMSTTTIAQYINGKLALSAFCKGIGRHTFDDVLVLEFGDKDGAVAFGGVLS